MLEKNSIQPVPRRIASWMNRVTLAVSDFALQRMIYPLLLAVAGGAGVWSLEHAEALKALARNHVSREGRAAALVFVAVAAVAVTAVYVAYYFLRKKRLGRGPTPAEVVPLNRALSFVFALPMLGILATPQIYLREAIFTVVLICGITAACIPSLYELANAVLRRRARIGEETGADVPPWRRALSFVNRYAPELLVFAMFVAYAAHFSHLSVNHMQALRTRTTDMTIYTNVLFHSLNGDWLGCSFMKGATHASAHFDPILILFTPLFALYQQPEFLLIFQSIWFAFGIFAAYLLGNLVLQNKWAGVVTAMTYGLHPCLHSVNMFEFHSLALISSPVIWCIYLIQAGHFRRYFALFAVSLLIREDVSLLMCFIAFWIILSKRQHAWVGAVTIVVSLAYFVVAKTVFMPSSAFISAGQGGYNYIGYFKYMLPHRAGLSDLVVSVVTNPVYTLKYLISLPKLIFVFRLLGPLMFLPLFAPQGRIMLLYGVIFLLLASRKAVFGNGFHYQILALPILIGLVPFALKRILEHPRVASKRATVGAALLSGLAISMVLSGVMGGMVVPIKSIGRYTYSLNPKQQKTFTQMKKFFELIEPDASVTASYSVAPYAAIRMNVYSMNHLQPKTPTDYLFLDRASTKKELLEKYDGMVEDGIYRRIRRYRNLELYKLVPEKERRKKPNANRNAKRGSAKLLKKRPSAPPPISSTTRPPLPTASPPAGSLDNSPLPPTSKAKPVPPERSAVPARPARQPVPAQPTPKPAPEK